MNLKNLLSEKKKSILKRWFNLILETYPPETKSFLKAQKNRFANPVGATILKGTEDLFEGILEGMDSDRVCTFLDSIIRVRAVQDFTASQAVVFIFLLKKVIRDELKNEIMEKGFSDELLVFESTIDDLALLSFDIFMKCREQIYELKANEVKNMTYTLLKRAKLVYDVDEQESAPEADSFNNLMEKR